MFCLVYRKYKTMIRIHKQFPVEHTINHLLSDLLKNEIDTKKTIFANGNLPMNIQETENDFIIGIIVPGYEKKDFSVTIENEMLTIEGKILKLGKNNDIKTIRNDYHVTNFKKSLHIDRRTIGEPKEATYENGILRIVLPKIKKEMVQRTHVQIN